MKIKITIVITFACIINAFSTRYYVNSNATGTNNGLNWQNAFTDLQSALSVAIFNDEIWVASGVYKPTSSNNRDISFVMKNTVNVYGGFNGTETAIEQRNLVSNPTTLSGDIGQLGDNTDNSKKIIKILNFTSNFVLDGFRIVSGYDWSETGRGAAIYCVNNTGQITINNCIFFNNASYHSGGAMLIKTSNITFNHCNFLYNSSYNYGGGAIYCANVSNSNLYFYDTKFIGNTSRRGAAINFSGHIINFDRNIFSSNTSSSSIIYIGDATEFVMSNSLVAGNLVTDNSSSILTCYASRNNVKKLINVTFAHNNNNSSLGPYYEMIYNANGSINMYNSIIYGNYLTNVGRILNKVATFNCIIQGGLSNGLDANPNFINPSNLNSAPFDVSNFDYGLSANSPAINYGDNTYVAQYNSDLFNNVRIQNNVVDCGAIESNSTLSVDNDKLDTNYYFNNATNVIIFKNLENKNSTISIFDIMGRLRYKTVLKGNKLALNLQKGVYFYKINNAKSNKILIYK